MHRGYDAKGSPTRRARGRVRLEGGTSKLENRMTERLGHNNQVLVRTDSPPLHLRNAECEPIIFSRLGLFCRYCFKRGVVERLSAHTINSNPGEIDENTTTMRVRGAGGAQRLIRTSAVTFGWVPNAPEPTESDNKTELEGEDTDSAKIMFDPSDARRR